MRLHGYADGWMVNGAGARCPEHKPDPDSAQIDNWTDYDRRSVIAELIAEGQPTRLEADPEARELADALQRLGG